ncbi:MAG: gliding motility-associated ABC transporter substrate-binding protein GldG [Bacteroidota bacterium]
MIHLLKKEINGFFSSLTGYVVIVVFLLSTGLFLWVFPGQFNILDNGHASLNPLFTIAPWVFLFLVPAVSMRLFSDEKKSGTIEFLFTQPLTEMQIVLAKYFAGVVLVLFSLIPTLIYLISVYQMGNPAGNIDMAGVWGSYIGLFFLAAIYVSIGVFSSSLTENQIVAFLIALLLSFFIYIGFESISSLNFLNPVSGIILNLGINEHYKSISRGVLDLRDIVYFISVIAIFIYLTKMVLESRKLIKKNIIKQKVVQLVLIFVAVILVNYVVSFVLYRIDMTSEGRYTISKQSENLLENLDDELYVKIYLDGDDLPVGFKRMRRSLADLLEEFKVYAGSDINYRFINPSESSDKNVRFGLYKQLFEKGLVPIESKETTDEGKTMQKMVFPGLIVVYKGKEMGVNLLKNNPRYKPDGEENINNSVQSMEYELTNAIRKLTKGEKPEIAFLEGHGELNEYQVLNISNTLSEYYDVKRGVIGGMYGILDNFKAVIIAGPIVKFSENDKFVIDQYIMKGGKVLWLLDGASVNMDSLQYSPITIGMPLELNLEDQLFRYGVRVNPGILQDAQCAKIGLTMHGPDGQPKINLYPWTYYPVVLSDNTNEINKYLDVIRLEYPASLDTVSSSPDVKKTILLHSSTRSKFDYVPSEINLMDARNKPVESMFNKSLVPVAVLLEGKFDSNFKNRLLDPKITQGHEVISKSKDTRMIVISNSSVIRNEISEKGETYPLGFDINTQKTFKGNKQLITNSINYLCDDEGLMAIRLREIKLRLLDKTEISSNKMFWQTTNTLIPILFVILFGLITGYVRKRKYTGD